MNALVPHLKPLHEAWCEALSGAADPTDREDTAHGVRAFLPVSDDALLNSANAATNLHREVLRRLLTRSQP